MWTPRYPGPLAPSSISRIGSQGNARPTLCCTRQSISPSNTPTPLQQKAPPSFYLGSPLGGGKFDAFRDRPLAAFLMVFSTQGHISCSYCPYSTLLIAPHKRATSANRWIFFFPPTLTYFTSCSYFASTSQAACYMATLS
jgi:hypothetical protein